MKVAIEKSETDRVRISDIVNDGKVAIEKCVSESSRINYTILILLGVGLLAQQYLLNVATLQSVREKALKTEPTYLSALTSILKGGLAAICDVARDSKSFNEASTLLQLSVKDDQCDEGGDICDTKVEIRGEIDYKKNDGGDVGGARSVVSKNEVRRYGTWKLRPDC